MVHAACEALGVPILTSERYEADDVIGTLAMKAAAAGFDVAIVTGDKDFFQLVGDGIRVFNPSEEGTWYDADGVKEKFGVAPEQVVDVLALMGDTIDNIKGVPGIGEKGARELIATYGSLDEPDRARAGGQAQALSRRAARARRRCTPEPRAGAHPHRRAGGLRPRRRCATAAPSRERCFQIFNELGFRTFVAEYAPTAGTIAKTYRVVNTPEAVRELAGRLRAAGRFALRVLPDWPVGDARRDRRPGIFDRTARGRLRAGRPSGARRHPPACRSTPRWTSLRPCSRTRRPEGRPRPEVRRDRAGAPRRHAPRARYRHHARELPDRRDAVGAPLEDLALEHTSYKALKEEDVCGRGAKAVSLADVPVDAAIDYAGERADLAGQIAPLFRDLLAREALTRSTRRSSCRWCRC